MKRLLYIVAGMLIGGALCVAIAWGLGAAFGPLYQGEDESTRNFKIFLASFVVFVIAGGISSNIIYKKKKF